jgi:hypothetical protein
MNVKHTSVVCSPPETLDRSLVDQIGGVEAKEKKNSFGTANNRIRIPQSCSQQVSHHTERGMAISVVGNLVLIDISNVKKKSLDYSTTVVFWM